MKLTLRWRFALILSLSLLAWTAADGQFTPTADSYTSTSAPTINYGNAATLNIGGAREVAYIQFDLSAIPEGYTGANLAQATLKLYLNSVATAGSFNVDYVDGTWSEKTITAALSPALGTTIASNISVEKTQAGDYIDINVTSAVAAWLSGSQANDGIALVANGTFYATVDSKENTGTSHPPELDIVFLGNGAEGPAGPAGPSGPQGPQGTEGPIGLTGPQGPAGPAGIVNMGTWVSTTAYQVNNSVGYNGSSWIALVANTNSAPGPNNANWQLLAAQGINNQGSWVSSINYQVNDAVTDGGQFWIAVAPNLDSEPSILNPNWQLIAASGATGPAGPAGPLGPQGAAGPVGATGPQGPQGATGSAGPQGPVGPLGLTGPQGPAGAQGPAATFAGTWTAANTYGLGSAVFYNGSSYVSLIASNSGDEPDTSPTQWALLAQQGATGATGTAGPAGPQGLTGPAGSTGAQGPAGPTGAAGPQGPAGSQGVAGPAGPQGPQGIGGTGLIGAQDFTSSGSWTAPAGVTSVIVEQWGAGGGGGLMGCGAFNLGAGNGGGGGAYTRSILTVTPGATYSVNVGTGGTVDVPGGNTSFTDASSDVLALAGGGVEGEDGCEEDACVYTRNCSAGGSFSGTTSIEHTGAGGTIYSASAPCPLPGGAGYSVPTLTTSVGEGGSGGESCTSGLVSATAGQNGYALLEW